jgi:hypothetical protein
VRVLRFRKKKVLLLWGNVMPGLYAGGDGATEYAVNADAQISRQGRGPFIGSAGNFGNYTAYGGGAMAGIHIEFFAAISIAEYLGKV